MTASDLRGVDTYRGDRIRVESWHQGYDFAGKRVAVVGTDSHTVRIVPELTGIAAFVKVFQCAPRWILPYPVPAEFTKAPVLQWGIARLAQAHLRTQVADPWLRRQLTPDNPPEAAEMLVSSHYYPALQQAGCKLIDWPIATFSPVGVRTSDGVEHHVDVIVFGDARGRDARYLR